MDMSRIRGRYLNIATVTLLTLDGLLCGFLNFLLMYFILVFGLVE